VFYYTAESRAREINFQHIQKKIDGFMKDPEIQRGHMLQKATLLRYTIV
jgi:hypothetical protein